MHANVGMRCMGLSAHTE